MAEPQVRIRSGEASQEDFSRDIEMGERDNAEVVEILETGLNNDGGEGMEQQEEPPASLSFIEYVFHNFYEGQARAKQ